MRTLCLLARRTAMSILFLLFVLLLHSRATIYSGESCICSSKARRYLTAHSGLDVSARYASSPSFSQKLLERPSRVFTIADMILSALIVSALLPSEDTHTFTILRVPRRQSPPIRAWTVCWVARKTP